MEATAWQVRRSVRAFGREWTLVALQGTVLQSSVGSETHVSSHGGGGIVIRHGGVITAPKVKSEVKYRTRTRVQPAAGLLQADVSFEGEVAFSPGDRIEFIGYRIDGREIVWHWVNRTTDASGESGDHLDVLLKALGGRLRHILAYFGFGVAAGIDVLRTRPMAALLVILWMGVGLLMCAVIVFWSAYVLLRISTSGNSAGIETFRMLLAMLAGAAYSIWSVRRGLAFGQGCAVLQAASDAEAKRVR